MTLNAAVPDGPLDVDGYNLANSAEHQSLIVRAIENLAARPSISSVHLEDLVRNLVHDDTYGKFSELAAYDWLIRLPIQISAQIPLSPSDVLGANGATPDGFMDYVGLYFDIKSFGFHGHLARRFKERLEQALPGKKVFVEGSWSLSIDVFQCLIASARKIAKRLQSESIVNFGHLRLRVEDPKPIDVSVIEIDPYRLAHQNKEYAFRFSSQFTKKAPFILIFVLHPWFNQSAIHHDFANSDTMFTRALARRTFIQFSNDNRFVDTVCDKVASGTTFADAAKLLSAIVFLNVWPNDQYPPGSSESKPTPSWVYLNPRALHPLNAGNARLFAQLNPHIAIDDFRDDNY